MYKLTITDRKGLSVNLSLNSREAMYEKLCQLRKERKEAKNPPHWLFGSVVPIRTDIKHIANDLFVPTIARALKTHQKAHVIYAAFCWDAVTLALRCITVVPRIFYNKTFGTFVPLCLKTILKKESYKALNNAEKLTIECKETFEGQPSRTIYKTQLSKNDEALEDDIDLINTLPPLAPIFRYSFPISYFKPNTEKTAKMSARYKKIEDVKDKVKVAISSSVLANLQKNKSVTWEIMYYDRENAMWKTHRKFILAYKDLTLNTNFFILDIEKGSYEVFKKQRK